MVRDSAVVTMESLLETTIAISNGTVDDNVKFPVLQNGVSRL